MTKLQDDISFQCPACQGSLVADIKCAGISLSCPHCLKWIQVPFPEGYDFENQARPNTATEAVKGVLENELETTRQKLRKSRADVTALETELKAARSQSEPLRAALEAATKRVTEAREETARAQAQLAAAITSRDDAEVGRVIAEKAAKGADQLRGEVAVMKTAASEDRGNLQTASRTAEEAQAALLRESALSGSLQHELDEAQKRYKTVLATMQGEMEALREKTHAEIAGLQTELAAAIAARDEAGVDRGVAEKANADAIELREKLSAAHAAVAHLHEQCATVSAACELADLALQAESKRVSALQHEFDEAQKRYKSVLTAKQDEVDALEAKQAQTLAEIEEMRLSPAQEGLNRATLRLAELERQIAALQSERTSLLSTRQDQSQIIEQLYEERSGVARELEQADHLRSTLEGHIRSLESNIEGLNAALSASQAGRLESAQRLAAEANEHTKTRQELEALRAAHEEHLGHQATLHDAFANMEKPFDEIRRALASKKKTREPKTPGK